MYLHKIIIHSLIVKYLRRTTHIIYTYVHTFLCKTYYYLFTVDCCVQHEFFVHLKNISKTNSLI